MSNHRPTVAFLETAAQVDGLLAELAHLGPIDILVALTPEAAWQLMQNGIEYARLEDFYNERDLWGLSFSILDQQAEWGRWVDNYLQQNISQFKEHNFYPTHYYFRWLKVCTDTLIWRGYALEHLFQRTNPGRVVIFEAKNSQNIDYKLFFPDFVHSLIVSLWAKHHDLQVLTVESSSSPGLSSTVDSTIEPTVTRHWILNQLPGFVREPLLSSIRSLRQRVRSGGRGGFDHTPIVVVHDGYDIPFLEAELLENQLKLVSWTEWQQKTPSVINSYEERKELSQTLERLWEEIWEEERFWKVFSWSDLDLRQVAESRVAYWWKTVIPDMWAAFVHARSVLSQRRPACVITTINSLPHEMAAINAARSLNIPTFRSQHGLSVGDNQVFDYSELFGTDYVLTAGKGRASYLLSRRARYPDERAYPVAVGSARLDAIQCNIPNVAKVRQKIRVGENKPMVLYVPLHFTGSKRYLNGGSYPDVSYFELQLSMIKLFGQFTDFQFIYKGFVDQVKNPLRDVILDSYQNVMVIDHRRKDMPSLTQLMWAADAIIVDFPSTALIETCLTKKPIIVYADRNSVPISPETKQMLRKRAALAETPDEFLQQTHRLLASGDFSKVESPDNSLLKAYGTHLDDGCSAQRAVEVIQAVIDEQPLPDFTLASSLGRKT